MKCKKCGYKLTKQDIEKYKHIKIGTCPKCNYFNSESYLKKLPRGILN